MLRKQTIWLLTMLSLVVVLSVYYVTGEPTSQSIKDVASDVASTNKEEKATKEVSDQTFDELRMVLADERSEQKSDLEAIIVSADATAEDKSAARDKMISLEETGQKEEMLEVLIESIGYEDVFVKVENEEVSIRIQSEELSKEQANKIIQLAEKELGVTQVAVSYQG